MFSAAVKGQGIIGARLALVLQCHGGFDGPYFAKTKSF
jgi:hypothetical protein